MGIKALENKLWLSSPTMYGEERMYVKEAFDTNWVSTVGENINQFEKNICKLVGCKYSVALASGTSALHLAVKLASVKPGDKVFCTDLTFDATVNPVSYEHGKQIFIDSEYETWNMNPDALRKAFEIYPEVKVVIVANLYGVPAQLDEIKKICDEHNATLIEDAAESLGATYKGIVTGTFGKYNAISFNGNKIITTSSGGMLLTDDKDSADLARKWSTQSREPAPWYQHKDLGYNYRMSNITAGIGRGQLLHIDESINRKREIYFKYKEGLSDLPVKMNPYLECSKPNFWLSCLIIDKDAMCSQSRDDLNADYTTEKGKSCPEEIRETLLKYNIESRPIWKPMHMQPIFSECDCVTASENNVAEDIFARGLCLPSDIKMTDEQQQVVIDIIHKCFE